MLMRLSTKKKTFPSNNWNFKNKGLKRIRYTTSHPVDFSEDLIQTYKNCEKLMPLIHLPVQSGSNKILEAMNRKHTVEEYLDIINKLKKLGLTLNFQAIL